MNLSFSGSDPVTSEKVRYLGTAGHQKVSDGSRQYYHGDLIDSVWMTTAGDATPAGFASYTAFGELLDSNGSPGGNGLPAGPPAGFGRYQYAGGWGYESPAGESFPGAPGGLILAGVNPALPPIALLHVGARWYDPSLGRFIQRDPIGLAGGLNPYQYGHGNPLIFIDDGGLRVRPIVKAGGAAIGAGIVGGICHHECIERGRKAAIKVGTEQAIVNIVRQHIQETGDRNRRIGVIPRDRFLPSTGITRCIYHRLPDGRISIGYTCDGIAYQFYTDDDDPRR